MIVTVGLAQLKADAVPVPATNVGAVVALVTVTIALDTHPLLASITPVYVPAAVKVTTLVFADPEIPEAGDQVYPAIEAVDVIPTDIVGDAFIQLMLGVVLLNVNVGAFASGIIVAVAAAAEQPLVPVTIQL